MPDVILKHVPGMKNASPVTVLEAGELRENVFRETYISGGRPCLIKGAVRHWAALEKWHDREYLQKLGGHHQVVYAPHENHVSLKRTEPGKQIMTFAEALDRLHSAEYKVAACGTSVPTELAADLGDFSFLTRTEPGFLYPPIRYFFHRNAGSSWHYHPFDETLMCQIIGTKKVGLLNAENSLHKTVRDVFLKEDYYDHAFAFDGVANADLHWLSATVEQGDALYIPPLWWHGVIPVREGFGVTAAVIWRSQLDVVANTIKKMATGEIDMIGAFAPAQFQNLFEVARKMGVEQELAKAWKRGIRE